MRWSYGYVYMKKYLAKYEIEEERALRRLRKERDHELEHLDGMYKYGRTESGIEFFWVTRSDLVNCSESTEPKEEQYITTALQPME